MIKLKVQGEEYLFDEESMLMAEARAIKKLTGMTPLRWQEGLNEMDPDAIQVLVYLVKKRAGLVVKYDDLETLDLLKDIDIDPVTTEGEGEPDPTTAGPTLPAPETPTSPDSPPSSNGHLIKSTA